MGSVDPCGSVRLGGLCRGRPLRRERKVRNETLSGLGQCKTHREQSVVVLTGTSHPYDKVPGNFQQDDNEYGSKD